MKKSGFILSSLFSTMSLLSVVSAQTVLDKTATSVSNFLSSIYLTPDNSSKLLLGILLYIVIFTIVSKIGLAGKKKGNIGAAIASLIIVILSVFYLPDNFIAAIIAQYGAMGATILTVIPFMIILYFSISVSKSLFVARVTWVFYILYYMSLFFYKTATATDWKQAIPYVAAMIAGIIIFFILPTVRNLVFAGELSSDEEAAMRDVNFRELGKKIQREEAKEAIKGAKEAQYS